jgi:hypothetical protein
MKNTIPASVLRDLLDSLTVVGALLTGAVVKLYKNDITPDQTTVLADFDEADFTGYAASAAITWGAAFTDILGLTHLIGDIKTFTLSALTTVNTVYGYYITNGADLIAASRFDVAQSMTFIGAVTHVLPTFEVKEAEEPTLP